MSVVSARVRSEVRSASNLHDVLQQLNALKARVAQLEARRSPWDLADAELVQAIAGAAAGLAFTARGLWVRRQHGPALKAALLDANIDNARSLGRRLGRLEDRD